MLEVRTYTGATLAVCRVAGEIDSCTAPVLREALGRASQFPRLAIDLSELSFLDTAGLRALVAGIRRSREAGADVVVCAVRPNVARLLGIAGLDRVVPSAPTLGEAVRELLRPAASPVVRSDGPKPAAGRGVGAR